MGHERETFILQIKMIAAFSAIYLIWGSTYLAIRIAIDSIPPFLMSGTRFVIAGLIFWGWCSWHKCEKPGFADWKRSGIVGLLLVGGGNGALVWSEQYLPSGLASLVLAMIPVWMVLLSWIITPNNRPDKRTIIAIGLGLSGVVFLSGMDNEILLTSGQNDTSLLFSVLILSSGGLSWAVGSIFSKHRKSTVSLPYTLGMQMLIGGAALITTGLANGEWSQFSPNKITFLSTFSLIYLIIFGTLIAYGSYVWLLDQSTPAKVGSYAFFNPLIAVFLGWLLIDEPVTPRMLIGACGILLSVLLVNSRSKFNLIQKFNFSFLKSNNIGGKI